jgi:hypothetical protein
MMPGSELGSAGGGEGPDRPPRSQAPEATAGRVLGTYLHPSEGTGSTAAFGVG